MTSHKETVAAANQRAGHPSEKDKSCAPADVVRTRSHACRNIVGIPVTRVVDASAGIGAAMDFAALLKSEISAKRKAVESVAGPNAKYVRRADLEAKREQEYFEQQQRLEAERAARARSASPSPAPQPDREATPTPAEAPAAVSEKKETKGSVDAKEVIRRLRLRDEPIRLFGETDEERVQRLRALEAKRPDDRLGHGNEYMRTVARLDHDIDLQELRKKEAAAAALDGAGAGVEDPAATKKVKTLDELRVYEEMIRKNRDLLQTTLAEYFEMLLNEQGDVLMARPAEVKRTQEGKLEAANFEQTKANLGPFFKMLRKKEMPLDILSSITKIAQRLQDREYILANDEYYLLSIGNAAWPIGVTMVGIHARSAREKISSNQVARTSRFFYPLFANAPCRRA